MAKHDADPVLRQLVRAVNESETAAVPVTLSVHGTTVTGDLVSQRRYFAGLVEGNPLMNALEPSSGLLGKDYVKDTESASDHHLHILGDRAAGRGEGLWRVSLEAVDAWTLRRAAGTPAEDDRGPFARLLGTP
jgi:hypothetical protein